MKKTLKIIGVLAIVFTLVANLQYAFMSYDVQTNPNMAFGQGYGYPPNTSSPTNQYLCSENDTRMHGEYYWYPVGSAYYVYNACPTWPPYARWRFTQQAFTQKFSARSDGTNCGYYDGYTTGWALFTVASTVLPCGEY